MLITTKFNERFPGQERNLESLRIKFETEQQAFRSVCRRLTDAAKSGASRDDLDAIPKPKYYDAFMAVRWHEQPMASPDAVSLSTLPNSEDANTDGLPQQPKWYDILYPGGYAPAGGAAGGAPAVGAAPAGGGEGADGGNAECAGSGDAAGDAAAEDEDFGLRLSTDQPDAPMPGGALGGTKSAGKNKTHEPRGRPSLSAQSARSSAAAHVMAEGQKEAMQVYTDAMAKAEEQRAQREAARDKADRE